MDSGALPSARQRVQETIASLTHDLEAMMAASESSNADDEHDPEGATIAFERAQITTLLAEAQGRLEDIERALLSLRSGTYGRCATCGDPIGEERLVARPAATTCIACARRR